MDDGLFLEQYRQIWEQKRQHVGLYWKIPVITTALFALIFSNERVFTLMTKSVQASLISFALLIVGLIMLYLRHNFFQEAYGHLLKEMDSSRIPLSPTPVFGKDLRKRKDMKQKLSCCSKIASHNMFNGMNSWALVISGIIVFTLFVIFDLR